MSRRNEKFRQFWYHYLLHHSRRGTRLLHYLGLTVAIAGLILGTVILNPIIPILGIALAYMLSWSGHLLIEHNRPTLLEHPVWALQCDVRMFRLWLAGRLSNELARAQESQ